METKTKAERIQILFNHQWPSDAWHVQFDASGDRVTIRIRGKEDLMDVFASIYFTPKVDLVKNGTNGYQVEINYPAFNGSFEQMDSLARLHVYLVATVKKMYEAPLIKGE